ncbi:MAG TPA: CD225/dispanin family protein [Yinghuangia sp.]|uniref:CD225/dispanin family protein n=1 Tax=Yinghuangia sp. YIM S10712 TaxID=3436930 RepID=UPI002BE5DCC6|nr:CD225/dispanin family protein [Yinghuangia sp.]
MTQGYPPQQPGGPRPSEWGAGQQFGNAVPPVAPTTPYGYPGPAQPPGFQPPGMPPVTSPPPDNYLVWAILATVFCCFPAGIPALVAATSVNERWLRGDTVGARDASLRARNWTIGAVLLGVIFWTTWMVGVFVLGWKDTLGDL